MSGQSEKVYGDTSRPDVLDMLRHETQILRHRWALAYGDAGKDAITRALDTVIAGMLTEAIVANEHEARRRVRNSLRGMGGE